jgi:hypothetical protein
MLKKDKDFDPIVTLSVTGRGAPRRIEAFAVRV